MCLTIISRIDAVSCKFSDLNVKAGFVMITFPDMERCSRVLYCCVMLCVCTQAAHCYIHIAALLAEYLKRRGT